MQITLTYTKAIHKVEDTPSDDNIVINCYEESNNTTADADATKPRMNRIPYAKWAETHPLTDAELDEEQWNSLKDQHNLRIQSS